MVLQHQVLVVIDGNWHRDPARSQPRRLRGRIPAVAWLQGESGCIFSAGVLPPRVLVDDPPRRKFEGHKIGQYSGPSFAAEQTRRAATTRAKQEPIVCTWGQSFHLLNGNGQAKVRSLSSSQILKLPRFASGTCSGLGPERPSATAHAGTGRRGRCAGRRRCALEYCLDEGATRLCLRRHAHCGHA